MLVPIFIPGLFNDCDCDNKHGYDCECSKCKKEKEWKNKPKEYYEERYAIPKKAYRINLFFKLLSFLPFVIWGIAILFSMYSHILSKTMWFMPIIIIFGGGVLSIIFYNYLDKLVKYEWNIKGAIRLEKKRWFSEQTWEEIFKKLNLSKDKYHFTKPKDNWRYE